MRSRTGIILVFCSVLRAADSSGTSADSAALNQALADVNAGLARSDWSLVDNAARRLSVIPSTATITEDGDLLPAIRLYSAGRTDDARNAAAALIASKHESMAVQFALFLNSRRRATYLPAALGPTGAIY